MEDEDYYTLTLDTDAIHQMDRREALALLDRIRHQVAGKVVDERARVAAAEVREEQARHRPGAPTRAAKTLGVSPSRISKLWAHYTTLTENGDADGPA